MATVYIVDTNSLLRLKQYPPEVFETLWQRLENLVDASRLIAPHEVFRELAKGDDEIERWARAHRRAFVDLDAAQVDALTEVHQRFPALHDPEKTDADADPILVALCLARTRTDTGHSYCIVTEERLRGPGSMKLRNVCQQLGLEAISLLELFRREGFRF